MFHVKHALSPDDIANAFHLEHETVHRLNLHLELLQHWQRRVNLVATSTLADPWRRHVLDSLQLISHLPDHEAPIVDLGSGAGYPGLALAIATGCQTFLIEADVRKASFLREAIRRTAAPAKVLNDRIESLEPLSAPVVTARALAPLDQLLEYADRHTIPTTTLLFLKGKSVDAELTEASKNWNMTVSRHVSQSDASGVVLKITDLQRRDVVSSSH